MKNQNILISAVIIALAILAGVYLMRREVEAPVRNTMAADQIAMESNEGDQSFMLQCNEGKEMMVTLHLPANESADVLLSDGRMFTLGNTTDTTGQNGAITYTSADGATLLAVGQTEIVLVEGGTPTYAGCIVQE